LESRSEEFETVLEELVVVVAIKDWVVDVANQVLEETANHYVNDLANLKINLGGQCCLGMVLLKFLAARHIFFSSL
jgi:hypothetical protein